MAFRTDREKSKWDALQHQGATTIDKIVAGKALPEEIKQLSALVKRQYEGASKIFDEGIAGAEATADSIVDKMNRDRTALGKAPLTPKAQERLFKQTFQKVLSESSADILGSVKDYMDEKFAEQDEAHKDVIDDAFDRIRKLGGSQDSKSGASSMDVWSKRPGSTVPTSTSRPSVAGKLDSLFGAVTKVQAQVQGSGKSISSLVKTLTEEQPAIKDTGRQSILGNLRSMFKDKDKPGHGAFQSLQDVLDSYGVKSNRDVKTSVLAQNSADPTLASKSPVEVQIKDALEANKKLRSKAEAQWEKMGTSDGEADEDKKSTSWLRKVKAMFGDKKKKDKDSMLGGKSGWLGTIGKVLLMALLNPELIGSIAKTVGEYLNFDSITSFVGDTWNTIKEAGSNTINWVIDKIKGFFGIKTTTAPKPLKMDPPSRNLTVPANTTAATAKMYIPEIEKTIARTQASLAQAQAADQANSTPATRASIASNVNRLTELNRSLSSYQDKLPKGEQTTAGAKPMAVPSLTAASPGAGGSKTTVSASGPAGPSSAAALSNSSAATKVTTESPARYKEGVAIPTAAPTVAPLGGGGGGSTSSSPVSISSFSFNSGDDTLNLLNMGLLS